MPYNENPYRVEDEMQSSQACTRREFNRGAFNVLVGTALGNLVNILANTHPAIAQPQSTENQRSADFLTTNVFSSEYAIDKTAAVEVKEQIYRMDLETLLKTYILTLPADSVRDFLIPTGQLEPSTHTLQSGIDMTRGMGYMWDDKLDTLNYFLKKGFISKENYERAARSCRLNREKAVEKMKKSPAYNTEAFLRDLQNGIETVLAKIHAVGKKYYSRDYPVTKDPERNVIQFLQIVMDSITPRTFLAIAMQEMIASHYLSKKINPLFKQKYFDELIRKGGKNFMAYFPARYDMVESFGPFQMTNIALPQFTREYNHYVDAKNRVPDSMSGYDSVEDHINATLMNSYKNLETLACNLQDRGALGGVMAKIKKLPEAQKEKLAAGIIAILHHQPTPSMKAIAILHQAPDQKLLSHLAQNLNKQLLKYYESTVEAYAALAI